MERVPITETGPESVDIHIPTTRREDVGSTRNETLGTRHETLGTNVPSGQRTETTHPFGERVVGDQKPLGEKMREGFENIKGKVGETVGSGGQKPIGEKLREGYETVKGRVMESPQARGVYDTLGQYGRKIKETTHPFYENTKRKIGDAFDEKSNVISKLSNAGTILGGSMIVLGSLLALSSAALGLAKWGWNYLRRKKGFKGGIGSDVDQSRVQEDVRYGDVNQPSGGVNQQFGNVNQPPYGNIGQQPYGNQPFHK